MLPLFSGNYLWDDKSYRVELEIRFSQPITSISLSFATVEQYASMERDKLSILQLAAFLSESTTTLVGSTSAQGSVLSGTFPQGTLSYSAGGRLFNQVRLTIPPQPYPAAQFYIDNIVIITS